MGTTLYKPSDNLLNLREGTMDERATELAGKAIEENVTLVLHAPWAQMMRVDDYLETLAWSLGVERTPEWDTKAMTQIAKQILKENENT